MRKLTKTTDRDRLRSGFTIVELLVVIAIIGILVALLLPAVQSAREAARASSCRSNLRQIALATLLFEETHDEFPQGGWGSRWVGVHGRGAGTDQPGGWVYRIAPYLEDATAITSDDPTDTAYVSNTIAVFLCPSRRGVGALAPGTRLPHQPSPLPGGPIDAVARGDYAINSGTVHASAWLGPTSLGQGDSEAYWQSVATTKGHTGISHLRTSARASQIVDGLSKTYLAGEKFLAPAHYESSRSIGDDDCLYSGYDLDNHRFVASQIGVPPATTERYYRPYHDYNADDATTQLEARYVGFGSAHATAMNIANCDGSVAVLEYDIDPLLHRHRGHREDGDPLP